MFLFIFKVPYIKSWLGLFIKSQRGSDLKQKRFNSQNDCANWGHCYLTFSCPCRPSYLYHNQGALFLFYNRAYYHIFTTCMLEMVHLKLQRTQIPQVLGRKMDCGFNLRQDYLQYTIDADNLICNAYQFKWPLMKSNLACCKSIMSRFQSEQVCYAAP